MKTSIITSLCFIISILSVSGQSQQVRYDFSSDKDYRDTEERYTQSPYAMFGDTTKTLTTKHERDKDHTLKILIEDGLFELNMRTGLVTIKDSKGVLSYSKQLSHEEKARFVTVDPLAEKYYSISPYVYCANNPIKFIDPNGEDIWIFYKDDDGNEQHWVFNGSNHKEAPKTKDNFISNFLMAYDHNISNGGGEFMQLAATSKDLTVNLKYGKNTSYIPNPKDGSDPYIQWNPNLGIKTNEGHVLSPATILEHEVDHNVRRIQDPNGFMEDAGYKSNGYRYINDSQYDYKEERRVIRGSERNTAYNNGEFPLNYVRPDHHSGSFITVPSPISTGTLMPAVRRNMMNKLRPAVPSIIRTLRGGGF